MMYYYVLLDENNKVTWMGSMPTQITADGYMEITEEQYNSGDLVGKYWNGSDFVDVIIHYYAVLNERDVVEDVIEYAGELSGTSVVEIDSLNYELLGLWYDRSDNTFKEQPIHVQAEHSTDSINYKDEDKWLSAKLDEIEQDIADVEQAVSEIEVEATDVLEKIKTVDGANSGLDADTVDGVHASGFATANHTHTNYATVTEVETLETAVNSKADASHVHTNYATTAEVDALETEVAGKAASNHTHTNYAASNHNHDGTYAPASHTHTEYATNEDVEALETAVDGKAAASHTHSNYASTTHNHDGVYAPATHAHTEYATTDEVDALETEIAGKANATHTHSNYANASDVTALQTAVNGKAAADHTHANYASVEDVEEIETALAGKAASTHTHTPASIGAAASSHTHTAAQVGAAASGHNHDDRYYTETEIDTKLSGKSDATHTHTPAGIGAATASHTHDDRYYTESEIDTKLAAKSETTHTHTASDVGAATASHTHTPASIGAAASSHNHDSAYISTDLLFTNSQGGVEYSYGSNNGKNILTEISNMPQGFHTIYSIAGTTGNPETSESYRYFIHKTSTTIGWIYAFGADGSVYSNYQSAAGTFKGWRTIHDVKRKPLWTGSYYMTAGHTATPSKKLSECEHGWMLLWSDYDPDTNTVNNSDFCTTMIPNRNWTGGTWNGASYYCDVPRYSAGTATDSESRVIKVLSVYDNKLVGSDNNNAAPRNDVILRAIYEF